MRISILSLLVVAGLAVAALPAGGALADENAAAPGRARVLAVKVGTILPVSGEPIEGGTILVEDGKIVAVGKDVAVPEGARVIAFPAGTAIPGLVAAYSTLAEGGADPEESVAPDVLAVDGFDFFARRTDILAGGVTTAYISPGRSRLLSGRGAVVRLGGGSALDRVLRDSVGAQVNLGESPKNPPGLYEPPLPASPVDPIPPVERQLPSSRLGQFYLLRKTLGPEDGPLGAVSRGEEPLFVRAHAAKDIAGALRLAGQTGARPVIQGATEAHRVIEEIREAKAAVALAVPCWPGTRPPEHTRPDPEAIEGDPSTASRLAEAGVPLALLPPSDAELADLIVLAARAHAAGLAEADALKAVTLAPATILGIADRVGTLEPGKDADVVILSGAPFATRSLPEVVIAGGDVVYERQAVARRLAPASGKGWVAVRAARILTVSQGEIRDGTILIQDGKIRAVGNQVPVPEGAEVIDTGDSVVVPGFVDVQSRLGLPADEARGVADGQPLGGPNGGRIRASDALVWDDPAFDRALEAGITTAVVIPGGAGSIVGQAVAVKCAGEKPEDRVVADPAGILFHLAGGSGLDKPWAIRGLVKGIQDYEKRMTTPPKDEKTPPPTPDENWEPLRPLLKGELTAFVRASTPVEIQAVLEVFVDEHGIRTVLVGAESAYLVADEIRKRGVRVAAGQEVLRKVDGEWVPIPLRLVEAGVGVAFQSSGANGAASLPLTAAYAVRHGLDEATALRSLTLWPAQMAGIDGRVGSIEVGKDADLLVLSGGPMELGTRIDKVILGGEVVHE